MELQERWNRLANELALDKRLYSQFLYWYTHPHRAYHSIKHIEDCLKEFECAEHLAKNRHALELAIWFHDAIYDISSKTNEEESAELAYEILTEEGLPEIAKNVYRLVLATKDTRIPKSTDAKLIVDIDRSILGKQPQEFEEYEKKIGQEYLYVPELRFNTERRKFLQKILNRKTIYQTDFFRQKYETTARKNLEHAVSQLI